jgi:lysozyme family protein
VSDFLKAHTKTSAHEAGYANDRIDRGGETWAGITRRDWPDWPGWAIVDAAKKKVIGDASSVDLPKPARQRLDAALMADGKLAELVAALYKARYWDPLDLDSEPSQMIAEKAYDIGVNQGVGTAKKFLEEARRGA